MGDERVTVERDGHVLLIGFNRPDKRNAADLQLLAGARRWPTASSSAIRSCAAASSSRTATTSPAGSTSPTSPRASGADGLDIVPEGGINPWQVGGRSLTKPVVIAVQGTCLTLGIELMLASDIVVAADSTVFGQIEVARGILPFGGATIRFPRAVGWGNAMRWILTGDTFDAAEALRIGLVQEVVPHGEQFDARPRARPQGRRPGAARGAGGARERPHRGPRRGCRGGGRPAARARAARDERRCRDRHGGVPDQDPGRIRRPMKHQRKSLDSLLSLNSEQLIQRIKMGDLAATEPRPIQHIVLFDEKDARQGLDDPAPRRRLRDDAPSAPGFGGMKVIATTESSLEPERVDDFVDEDARAGHRRRRLLPGLGWPASSSG